jgi:hypothetical protein
VDDPEIHHGVLQRLRAAFLFIIHVRHSHQIVTLGVRRCAAVLRCVCGAHCHHESAPLSPICHFGCASVCLSVPVGARCSFSASLTVPGCSLMLLAAPGCSWLLLAASGCFWLLLAASGCSWLPLAAIVVNSRSKENNLFRVMRWNHFVASQASNCMTIHMYGDIIAMAVEVFDIIVCLLWT